MCKFTSTNSLIFETYDPQWESKKGVWKEVPWTALALEENLCLPTGWREKVDSYRSPSIAVELIVMVSEFCI